MTKLKTLLPEQLRTATGGAEPSTWNLITDSFRLDGGLWPRSMPKHLWK
jgi:hypothetical protein